ncbi:MAG: hypothetical protein AAF297_05785 [Planctomycetota bacterium]
MNLPLGLLIAITGVASAQPDEAPPEINPQQLLEQVQRQAQPTVPADAELSPAVRALLEAPYLSETERQDLRIEHGVWLAEDLDTPERRARAALLAGAFADESLTDEQTPATLRAHGALLRGELALAIELTANDDSLSALRVRTEALMQLGRYADAEATAQAAVDRMVRTRVEDSTELAEGVRVLLMRTKLRGTEGADGADYRAMTQLLADAREREPLNWRVRLAEAELLYDKHNLAEAAAAAAEVISLCPRNADALYLLARVSTDTFDIGRAESIADELDRFTTLVEGDEDHAGLSIQGAAVRARAMLRVRSPDQSIATLDAVLDSVPEHRDLLALRAAAAAVSFDDDARDRLLAQLNDLSPGWAGGPFAVGAALSEARQYDEAAAFLGEATTRLPNWSQPWIDLGLLQVQAGNDAAALAALETAMRLDPFDQRAANSLELVRELRTYEVIEGEHFAIRYRAGIDELLAREMLPVMDEIHDRVAADPTEFPGGLGHEPDRKTLIELMPNHRWFSVRITGMTSIHTIAAATGPVIAMESPQVGPGFSNGPFDWPRVLQHEYGHTVALSRTRNRVPHWFTEAASVALEDAPRDWGTWRLLAGAFEGDTLFDLDGINIAFVRPEKPTDRGQAYAQGHWMYQFIQDGWGVETPLRLMDRYAAGENEASAFEAELGVDRETFMDRFLAWAEDSLRSVGMVPAADAPTVPEMIRAEAREGEQPAQPDRAFVNRWIEQFPGHPDLLELSARIALTGTPAADDGTLSTQLIEALNAYAAARPVDDWPHRLLARHYLSLEGDARFPAIEHLEFLDAREQSSIAFAAALARLHAERGEHELAGARAERATRIAPFDADTRELAARVALVAGDTVRAQRHIEALVFLEPDREIHRRRLDAVQRIAAGG